jgi:CheY-specific phosphatase CheX
MEAAEKMTEVTLRRAPKSRDEVLGMAAEFANIFGGVACSMLNKKEKAFGLKVAPPNVFHGAASEIISPNINIKSIYADTDFGRVIVSIGFKKGSVLWM